MPANRNNVPARVPVWHPSPVIPTHSKTSCNQFMSAISAEEGSITAAISSDDKAAGHAYWCFLSVARFKVTSFFRFSSGMLLALTLGPNLRSAVQSNCHSYIASESNQ